MRTPSLLSLMVVLSLSAPAQQMLDRIIAVVDKEIITESELNDRVALLAMQNRLDPNSPELKREVLDGMVTEKLILAQALIDSIEVTDAEITQALDQQIQNFIRQVGSESRVEQIYGKSVNRIRVEYRDEVKQQLLVQKVRQVRESKIDVTRREIEEFYEAYRDSLPEVPEEFTLSHIFMVPRPDSSIDAATRATLQSVLDSIKAGGDFADFARRYSSDGTASSGGDLGWAKRGDYVREFETAVFGLQEGQISGVIKTQYGYHIVQLMERRGESVRARHILLQLPRGAAADSLTVQRLRDIRQQILGGASFAELAKASSEDEDTKKLGGDLGSVTADQLVPEFATTVLPLKEGDISQPSRVTLGTSYGWHIVWLRKRVLAHPMTLEQDYERVKQVALYMKRNRKNLEWVEELKKTIYLDIRL